MKKTFLFLAALFIFSKVFSQTTATQNDGWHIVADKIDPSKYFGVTMANGMIGIVSSPVPMQVKDVVLNGAFDTYGRGRVSNIMKVFSFANMNLDVNGKRLAAKDLTGMTQTLDMQNATDRKSVV